MTNKATVTQHKHKQLVHGVNTSVSGVLYKLLIIKQLLHVVLKGLKGESRLKAAVAAYIDMGTGGAALRVRVTVTPVRPLTPDALRCGALDIGRCFVGSPPPPRRQTERCADMIERQYESPCGRYWRYPTLKAV